MTANTWLIIFLLVFWVGLWVWVKVNQLIHGRPLSDGPSFIPVLPILPLVAYGIGWLLNLVIPWLGTGTIVAIHVGYLVVGLISSLRDRRGSGDAI